MIRQEMLVFDLISKALGLTEPVQMEWLKACLDLYVSSLDTKSQPFAQQQNEIEKPIKPSNHFNEDASTKKQKSNAFSGAGSDVKKDAHKKLAAYRLKNGLGCFAAISKASGGMLSEAEIRGMFDAEPYEIAKWRALASALDKLEARP
ncbi:MAG: hypothetical protein RSC52_04415 [Oscillospiraceae bacterium]